MAPAWWRRGSKSEDRRKGKEEEGDRRQQQHHQIAMHKAKAMSFDEAMRRRAGRRLAEAESLGGSARAPPIDFDAGERVGHPLPRPAAAAPQDHSASGSPSVSSVSSLGSSSEETPDLGIYRCSEPSARARGASMPEFKVEQPIAEEVQERQTSVPVSPRKDRQNSCSNFFLNASAHPSQVFFCETGRSRQGSLSPGPKPREMKSLPHPLPLPPPGSPTSPLSRQLPSKWKKGKLIGSGTFGRVYAGFNSERGQMCAIKEVEVVSDNSESRKQLSQEINLLSQLSHPNIVQYYGSELSDGVLSVHLEYVSGGSIHKLLQDYGSFSEPVIRSYTRQILSGLAYLHARNTIHRDIKGANILVGTNGEVKLADFGMAKHIASYTSIRSFKGSPYWMAPEVIMNSNGYGLPADIWSLGCTVLEMATSKPPWNNFTGVQAIFKIGNSKDIPEIPNNLSNEAKNFVKLCLQRDPSARPTAAQLLEHSFVREQTKPRQMNTNNISRDTCTSSDGIHSPTSMDFAYGRSVSPLQMRHIGHSVAFNRSSEPLSVRMNNLSLPESPCSSPLRQLRQSNWSCLPSPPHADQALGKINYGLGKGLSFPLAHSSRYTDNWHDPPLIKGRSPYSSPIG